MGKRTLYLLFVIIFALRVGPVSAQVTIGSGIEPLKGALLDLKESESTNDVTSTKGMVLPRVAIRDLTKLSPAVSAGPEEDPKTYAGLTVYNTKDSIPLSKGIYVWDGEKWGKAGVRKEIKFFYMPSIAIKTDVIGKQQNLDLYGIYKGLFESPKLRGGGDIANNPTPKSIPFYKQDELYYYITDYDESVFSDMKLLLTGTLIYTVKAAPADGCSYINIVFVVK